MKRIDNDLDYALLVFFIYAAVAVFVAVMLFFLGFKLAESVYTGENAPCHCQYCQQAEEDAGEIMEGE